MFYISTEKIQHQTSAPKYYAGVGSRKTPPDIIILIRKISEKLSQTGWTLRSGGARAADKAFEFSALESEIYYADRTLENISRDELGNKIKVLTKTVSPEAWEVARQIATRHHPRWSHLSSLAKCLMTRNTFQLTGIIQDNRYTPSSFVVCWTPDGAYEKTTIKTGGTGQAIRIANTLNIPVFNLANKTHKERITKWLNLSTN